MNVVQKHLFSLVKRFGALAVTCLLLATGQAWADVTINLTAPNGATVTGSFSWLVEEDRTFDVIPDFTGTSGSGAVTNTLSLNFHRSYMPVVAAGTNATAIPSSALVAGKRYFVSVMPTLPAGATGTSATPKQSMSGAPLVAVDGAFPASIDVVSHPLPIRTSQISVFLFNDNNPINNQPDAPGQQELGLCGFDIHLYDAGGTYGASGGRISVDVFGNPLGTKYTDDRGSEIAVRGSGLLRSGPSGVLRIRNLAPAKYTIYAFAPTQKPSQADCPVYYTGGANGAPLINWPDAVNAADNSGAANQWMQTTTIEGTSGQDAWVKSNEPGYFREFGPPGHHVFIGFVARTSNPNSVVNPVANGASVSGRVVNIHSSRPPAVTFFNGKLVNQCRIGINEAAAGTGGGKGIYAGDCKPDGTFNISGLERGRRYQLAVWDKPLDNVFATYDFFTPATGDLALNDVPVFNWFSKLEGYVFYDKNQDGFRQGITNKVNANGDLRETSIAEPGIENQAVNIRFRDGSIYQSVKTDTDGYYEFPEFFPFFNWMVAEVDYLRYKATGVTIVTDNGGAVPVDNGWTMPSRNKLNPQPQFNADGTPMLNPSAGAGNNNLSRTEVGPSLLAGMQDFLGQTNILHWGKAPYVGTESGGITGIVHYASTRAEWDPTYATAENNEPGIPGVTVRLYKADPTDYKKALDLNGDGVIDAKDAVRIVQTDAWDDALPTNCQGAKYKFQGTTLDCYDGLRNFNQVRPAVFDGGYAFWDYYPNGQLQAGGADPTPGLPQGYYIVEVVPPVGYEVQKEEDKNVDFGEVYQISTLNEAVGCVGTRATPVPQFLKLFPDVEIPAEYRTGNRPLCDRKAIEHFARQNTAVDFHLFTEVPVAGHIVGMILDDLANEFDPNAPAFGEKYAPPFMPVSLRDFSGHEFSRVYSDIYGTYNALVPSTFSFNVPIPSGVSPNMVTACLNSPTKKDGNGGYTLDPHFNRQYSQFCYTFNYLPGKTTYLDTPVLPIAAFAGPQQYALDCDNQDRVPGIHSVTNASGQGPWVAQQGDTITIKSMGLLDVPNPLYNQEERTGAKLIKRDYGFGAVTPGQVTLNGVPLNITSWSNDQIVATVATNSTGTIAAGQLMVKRGDNGQTSMRGVTLHIGGSAPIVVQAGGNIQAAVDSAAAGSLITVAPGLYEEAVIVHKRVRLQGFGAGGVYINPLKEPAEKLAEWRAKACNLAVLNPAALLPGQAITSLADCLEGNPADNAPLLFGLEESAGILVFTSVPGSNSDALTWTLPEVQAMPKVQIDGFTVSGADHGGGIVVNGKAPGVEISNNRATGNLAPLGGGIRIGQFELTANDLYVASRTQYANIHNNEVTQNGNGAGEIGGGGGGISLYTGTHDYKVANNFICGNFSTGNGGGMAHVGISDNGVIEGNTFLHNQSFFQMKSVQGGGLSIEGLQSLAPATANLTGISTGSGNVKILNNIFQGNAAGAGDGGAISLNGVNGNEVLTGAPYKVEIYNNTINNNVAGVAGGGIALQDAVNVKIINNTIARNDSTATGSKAFNGVAAFQLLPPGTPGTNIPATTSQNAPGIGLSASTAQPGAGVASRVHSPALAAALTSVGSGSPSFSNPTLQNNIVWQNRTFFWSINNSIDPVGCQLSGTTGSRPCFGLTPNIAGGQQPVYSDFGVIGGANTLRLSPFSSVLTNVTGYNNTNVAGTPGFAATYFNGARNKVVDSLILAPESQTQNLQTAAAFDEGGNFIDLRFGPLTPLDPNVLTSTGAPNPNYGKAWSNPNVATSSPAANKATPVTGVPELLKDGAGKARSPTAATWTAGALEAQ
jgi:large repetitive protein